MSLVLVATPSEEPITAADGKLFLRVNTTADDALIASLITAARQTLEAWTGRALITQIWDLFADAFPATGRGLVIPKPRLQTVGSVSYVNPAGTTQVLATSEYVVDAASEPGWIVPAYGKSWPGTQAVLNAVKVRFTAGYGLAGAVPENVKTALKVILADLYEQRLVVGITAIGSTAGGRCGITASCATTGWCMSRPRCGPGHIL